MSQFTYKALDQNHTVTTGTIAAQNREEAAQAIIKRGLAPIVVKEVVGQVHTKGTIAPIDKITFCRYIATMLASGLSLSEGVEVLRSETKHPLMRQMLSDITYSLERGQQLSSVFVRYPNIFEPYFITLTQAGEVSGTLAEVFKYLEMELRAEYNLESKVKGALLYPAVVFSAMIGIGILMFFFVLPQIGKVFLNLRVPLPLFTRLMFSFSLRLSAFMVPIFVGLVLLAVLCAWLLTKPAVRQGVFHIVRPIPLVRDLIKKVDLARFNRIFSTLLKSAVPINQALEISLESLSWYEFRNLSKKLPEDISRGRTLAQATKETKIFPSLMIQMITAGEKSGTLDAALGDLATFYEQEVEEELKSLTQILEPVLMLLVGIGVGVMILSIIAPIYSVVGSFQQAASPGAPQ